MNLNHINWQNFSLAPLSVNLDAYSLAHTAFVLPLKEADTLEIGQLLLVEDAQARRQILSIQRLELEESNPTHPVRVYIRSVWGKMILNPVAIYRLSTTELASVLLDKPAAPVLESTFPALRVFSSDLQGSTYLKADDEEAALDFLITLLLNAKQEGLSTFLIDPYGIFKQLALPYLHIVELGRTHGFSVEAYGVERLLEYCIEQLPASQQAEAWRQWQACASQRVFRVQTLRELEELFLSTHSGLLFRLLNQFKQHHLFCEGQHQKAFHLVQEMSHAEQQHSLLVLDTSSISISLQSWVWLLLTHAWRGGMMPLNSLMVGYINRQLALPDAVRSAVEEAVAQGLNVAISSPLHATTEYFATLAQAHAFSLNTFEGTLGFQSPLTQGIPLVFSSATMPSDVSISIDLKPESRPKALYETHTSASSAVQAPPFVESFEAVESEFSSAFIDFAPEASPDEDEDEVVRWKEVETHDHSLQPHPQQNEINPTSNQSKTHADLRQYSSILGEMPPEWRALIETQLLNAPTAEDTLESPSFEFLDASAEIDSSHHIHPCLPDSMLEEVTPYLTDTPHNHEFSGEDEGEHHNLEPLLHVDYIVDAKEALRRKPHSTQDALENALTNEEPLVFGQSFDPYHIPETPSEEALEVPKPISSSLTGLEALDLEQELPPPSDLRDADAITVTDYVSSEHLPSLNELEPFESEGFYDDLLNQPMIEAHAPQSQEEAFADAFLVPPHAEPHEQLHQMTVELDAFQSPAASLPVENSMLMSELEDALASPDLNAESDEPTLNLDTFEFDLGVINRALQAEYKQSMNDTSLDESYEPSTSKDALPVEGVNHDAPVQASLNPEDPLSHFNFEMPHTEAVVESEESPTHHEEANLAEGLPEFLMPPLTEDDVKESELVQSFQAELDSLDTGYIPMKGILHERPTHHLPTQEPVSTITPPHPLDAIPVTHEPILSFEAPVNTPVEASSPAPIRYVQGMKVEHEVYGQGVIHSVVDIEDRLVLSIVFEKTGKRLIDPTLSTLKPV